MVDEEELNIEVGRRYLEIGGYGNFISTGDSGRALPLIEQHCPDVVLLDIQMPQIDGMEILAAIRSQDDFCQTPPL